MDTRQRQRAELERRRFSTLLNSRVLQSNLEALDLQRTHTMNGLAKNEQIVVSIDAELAALSLPVTPPRARRRVENTDEWEMERKDFGVLRGKLGQPAALYELRDQMLTDTCSLLFTPDKVYYHSWYISKTVGYSEFGDSFLTYPLWDGLVQWVHKHAPSLNKKELLLVLSTGYDGTIAQRKNVAPFSDARVVFLPTEQAISRTNQMVKMGHTVLFFWHSRSSGDRQFP